MHLYYIYISYYVILCYIMYLFVPLVNLISTDCQQVSLNCCYMFAKTTKKNGHLECVTFSRQTRYMGAGAGPSLTHLKVTLLCAAQGECS